MVFDSLEILRSTAIGDRLLSLRLGQVVFGGRSASNRINDLGDTYQGRRRIVRIVFGLALDGPSWPEPLHELEAHLGRIHCGPLGLLKILETRLGLGGQVEPRAVRIAQYQTMLAQADNGCRFYSRSFKEDPIGVSKILLGWRDELVEAGWNANLLHGHGGPPRLADLAAVELMDMSGSGSRESIPPGVSDRLRAVLATLPGEKLDIGEIRLAEPARLFDSGWKELIERLRTSGIRVDEPDEPRASATGDLGALQAAKLRGTANGRITFKGDDSLAILRSESEGDAADAVTAWLGATHDEEEGRRRVIIVPQHCDSLDLVLRANGQPVLGTSRVSVCRPAMQVLPLACSLLWDPLDPFRVLEFLTLPACPLPRSLTVPLAKAVSEQPGIGGPLWNRALEESIADAAAKQADEASTRHELERKLRADVERWFGSQSRFSPSEGAPVHVLGEMMRKLSKWAALRASGQEEPKLEAAAEFLSLSTQAKLLAELFDDLGSREGAAITAIRRADLERLVRLVQEDGVPLAGTRAEVGHIPCVREPGAIVGPADVILWWGFTEDHSAQIGQGPWTAEETAWLESQGVVLTSLEVRAERVARASQTPLFRARERLILVVPARSRGEIVGHHPMLDGIASAVESLAPAELRADEWIASIRGTKGVQVGGVAMPLEPAPLVKSKRWWKLPAEAAPTLLGPRETESYSSLEDLFYYPALWVLKHKARLRPSPAARVADGDALLGDLGHAALQEMLSSAPSSAASSTPLDCWSREAISIWFDENLGRLLKERGAVLLLPGREPDRELFHRTIKNAAWSLICHLRENGWRVVGMERGYKKRLLSDLEVEGYLDLLAERDGGDVAVIDIKRGGSSYRRRLIEENRALQLELYARLLEADGQKGSVHQAFFIIENGRLIAPDRRGFSNASVPPAAWDREALWRQIEETLAWRRRQLAEGWIEVPVDGTEPDDRSTPGAGCLAMPDEPPRFNDYAVLTEG